MRYNKISLSFLLIISIIVKTLNIDPIINLICLFTSCFVISYNCFNNVEDSIKYAVFLVIIFELLKILLNTNRYVFSEHLENGGDEPTGDDKTDDDKTDDDKTDDDKTDDDKTDDDKTDDDKTDDDKTSDKQTVHNNTNYGNEIKKLEEHLLNLDGKDEKQDKNTPIDDMSPAQAQRELYRLIDTTNLLKKTMTEMTPVLNEGKKIMKSIEALNMLN